MLYQRTLVARVLRVRVDFNRMVKPRRAARLNTAYVWRRRTGQDGASLPSLTKHALFPSPFSPLPLPLTLTFLSGGRSAVKSCNVDYQVYIVSSKGILREAYPQRRDKVDGGRRGKVEVCPRRTRQPLLP